MYHFSEKYGYSNGKMYIALVDEKLAGCVALTKNDDDYCEIKRLYIREEFRGNHLGNMLSEKIIEDAGAIGYKYMRLDTVPFMMILQRRAHPLKKRPASSKKAGRKRWWDSSLPVMRPWRPFPIWTDGKEFKLIGSLSSRYAFTHVALELDFFKTGPFR